MRTFIGCIGLLCCVLSVVSCGGGDVDFDASGIFESTEVVVSSQADGLVVSLDIEEGDSVECGVVLGCVDSVQLHLRKLRLEAQLRSVGSRRSDVVKQVAATREQISKAEKECDRASLLLSRNAGTRKQLEDAEAELRVLRSQLDAQLSTLGLNNVGVEEESDGVLLEILSTEDLLSKCRIVSPISGTVLTKYVEAGEMVGTGTPLFKVADMGRVFLRAYVTADRLTSICLGQKAVVYADYGSEGRRSYEGTVTWISSQAEFTPKTIQTRDERSNLVYAVKVAVVNDGLLKLGMYGEVVF